MKRCVFFLLGSFLCFTFADDPQPPRYDSEQCLYCNQVTYYTEGMMVSWDQIPGWDPNYIPVLESLVCDIYNDNEKCINVTDTVGTFVWADYMTKTFLDPCKVIPSGLSDLIDFFCYFCEFSICPQPIPSDKVCSKFGCP